MRIKEITIRNFRAFRDVTIKNIGGLGVFIGPNGSGKSTLLEVLKFLQDALRENLTKAVDSRGGFDAICTAESNRGIVFIGINFDDRKCDDLVYELRFMKDEKGSVFITGETIKQNRNNLLDRNTMKSRSNPNYAKSICWKANDDKSWDPYVSEKMGSLASDVLAVKALGQFDRFAEAKAICESIESWFFFNFNNALAREPFLGSARHLASDGGNLSQYIRNLQDNHPDVFKKILEKLAQRIPGLESVNAQKAIDGRVILEFKERAYEKPFFAKYVSDGTLTILAYLALLYGPNKHSLIAIDEPELSLFPNLLEELAEELECYSRKENQVFVTTHSPDFLNAMELNFIYSIEKKNGASFIHRLGDDDQLRAFIDADQLPGQLWRRELIPGSNLQ